ncbi:HopJ type III effector protein [Pseudoalteromonas sp. MMG012]|uniref:HopJ type III effector protein n=1 Tax=Pseudoalteromonas sp. MMG012 TaxID=2822686 RepID=UPI001B3A30C3|nr:HopJ type III effector protein [Pseudoalteromonas sp. MMG012]MBQ4850445.1 HopJ type III effector protein [Pseudoalteromonas sp. MMG012]
MKLNALLQSLKDNPDSVSFTQTMSVIDSLYHFTATSFKNSGVHNEAGTNSGSCKIFSFAQLHNLTKQQTLHCFGDYYRKDVLALPDAIDHQNIRAFLANRNGLEEVHFDAIPLSENT